MLYSLTNYSEKYVLVIIPSVSNIQDAFASINIKSD